MTLHLHICRCHIPVEADTPAAGETLWACPPPRCRWLPPAPDRGTCQRLTGHPQPPGACPSTDQSPVTADASRLFFSLSTSWHIYNVFDRPSALLTNIKIKSFYPCPNSITKIRKENCLYQNDTTHESKHIFISRLLSWLDALSIYGLAVDNNVCH